MANEVNFFQILQYLKPHKKKLSLSILSNILLSFFTVISIPLIIPFFQILFNRGGESEVVLPGEDLEGHIRYFFYNLVQNRGKESALTIVCIMLVIVFFFKNLFRYFALFFMAPIRNGVVRDIRKNLFDKLVVLSVSWHTGQKRGDIMSRALADVQEIEWSVLNVIEAVFKSPFILIGAVIYMISISPSLTLFVIILMVFTAFIIGGISQTLKRSSGVVQTKLGEISSAVEETLSGIRIIKAFNAQNFQKEKFKKINDDYSNHLTKLLWRRDLSVPMSEFLGVSVVAFLLWFGAYQVFRGELYPETFFSFTFAFYLVIEPVKSFSSAYYNIQKGLAAFARIQMVLLQENPIKESEDAVSKNSFDNKISFDDVVFSYNDSTMPALHHLNLEIKKNEVIALVGASGAGKSTLVDLLVRFRDATQGQISIDGLNIEQIKISDLRSLFAVVSQESVLFNDSIMNNISFGQEYTLENIIEASKVANAHDFIMQMPDGYQSNIGDKGNKLSGGQKQRITIARAVLRNAPILIMDEATSALDSESEKYVQLALDQLLQSRTAVVIAHRLSTVQKADRIVVMDKGKIVEIGNHHQLINKDNGVYKKLVEMQSFQ
jgi:ABC-type multidrug transport system fused ATPase/permease subunit